MITLASSSQTRAKILAEAGIDFTQIGVEFDESKIDRNLPPVVYVQSVVKAKKEQFYKLYAGYKNVLFADSCVECDGQILGKPRDEDDAIRLLKMQSDNYATVITAMIFDGENRLLSSVGATTYRFAKFDEQELLRYVKSGLCMDKAAAMMVEGFNKRYIISQQGYTSTARGLNVEILKAFL